MQAESLVEFHIHTFTHGAGDVEVGVEFFAEIFEQIECFFQSFFGAAHAHIVPKDVAQFFVDRVHRALATDCHEALFFSDTSGFGFVEFLGVGFHVRHLDLVAEIVLDGVREHEVAISQTLHQCRSTEAVSAVVGEVAFADSEQALHAGLQFVVYPNTAHGVVDGGVNHHGVVVVHTVDGVCQFAGVHVGDFFIHIEEVAIALAHHVDAEAVDGFREVEEHGLSGVVHTKALIAAFFSGTGSHVARHEVAESRIAAFEIVVAFFFRNVATLLGAGLDSLRIVEVFGHPDASVVAERFRHQRELGLLIAVARDASGVNLHVGRICKVSTFAIASDSCRAVASHSVGRKEVGVAIAAGGNHHGMSGKAFKLTGYQVFGNDTASATVHNHHIVHFVAVETLHLTHLNLAVERAVGAEQELLSGLTLSIESAAHLRTTE